MLLFIIPSVYAAEATITDLSCTKKTGGVESALNATVNGLDITIDDVTFEDVGDFMKCNFKVNNTSDDDLEVEKLANELRFLNEERKQDNFRIIMQWENLLEFLISIIKDDSSYYYGLINYYENSISL